METVLVDNGFTESRKNPGVWYKHMTKHFPQETAFLDFRRGGSAYVMHDQQRGGKELVNRLLGTILAIGDPYQRRLF